MKIKIKETKLNTHPTGGVWDAYIDEKYVACKAFIDDTDKFLALKEVIERAKKQIEIEVETIVNINQLQTI